MTIIPYVTFMKHAQKVANSRTAKTRPVLGGVMHRDGDLIVTDSHRLYVATDAYGGEDKNVNPKTGVEITEGNYPDVSRLMPEPSDVQFTAIINVDTAARATKLIEQAGKVEKATDLIRIAHDMDGLQLKTGEESTVEVSYKADKPYIDAEQFEIIASAKYVLEAFALFKDCKLEEVTFNFYGNMRPFTITGANLTALILPVRTY